MNIALVSLNVSYIHKNLALRWLYVAKPAHLDAKLYEYTTKQVDLCAARIIEDKPDVVGLSTYIFNVEATTALILKLRWWARHVHCLFRWWKKECFTIP